MRPKKLIFVGVDAAIPFFVKKLVEEGKLPFLRKLIWQGIFAEGLPSPPCETSTGWATIHTGAWSGTHGVIGSTYPLEKTYSGMERGVESLWDVAEREGKLCAFVGHPPLCAHPKKGIILSSKLIEREKLYGLRKKKRGEELILVKGDQKERMFRLPLLGNPLIYSGETPENSRWRFSQEEEGKCPFFYAQFQSHFLSLFRNKKEKLGVLKKRQWSDWVSEKFNFRGKVIRGFFKFKLLDISSEDFRLYRTPIFILQSQPPSLGEEIKPFISNYDVPFGLELGWFGKETVLEIAREQANCYFKAAYFLKKKYRWDILLTHFQIFDFLHHGFLGSICEESPSYDKKRNREMRSLFEECWRVIDEMIERICNQCADRDTLILIVSDHGQLPFWKSLWVTRLFIKHGLLKYKSSGKKLVIDWVRTKVYPLAPYIWVNLKDRSPQGIVAPKDYEKIREEIVDILYDLKDPETGERPIELVLRKEDAFPLGQWGERVGDLIYFLKPDYNPVLAPLVITEPEILKGPIISLYKSNLHTGAHGPYLPTAKLGIFSQSSLILLSGPGVKKKYESNRPVWLVDLAPTLAYLLGISPPGQSEGRVVREWLEEER